MEIDEKQLVKYSGVDSIEDLREKIMEWIEAQIWFAKNSDKLKKYFKENEI